MDAEKLHGVSHFFIRQPVRVVLNRRRLSAEGVSTFTASRFQIKTLSSVLHWHSWQLNKPVTTVTDKTITAFTTNLTRRRKPAGLCGGGGPYITLQEPVCDDTLCSWLCCHGVTLLKDLQQQSDVDCGGGGGQLRVPEKSEAKPTARCINDCSSCSTDI